MHRILPAPASLSTAAGEKIDTKWETGRRAAERERPCPPLPGVPLCPKENVRVPLCPRWPPSRRCLANARSARPRAGSEIGTRGIKTALHRNQQPNNRRKSNCRKHQRAACKPNRKRCYQSNEQYSITALTDATGSISERYAYDAYGKLTVLDGGGTVLGGSAYGNRYTYTGREWDDELGLYHFRARMYDPVAGRFCSRDPIGYIDGFSLQQAFRSNPALFADPDGLKTTAAMPDDSLANVILVFGDPDFSRSQIGVSMQFNFSVDLNKVPCKCTGLAVTQTVTSWSATYWNYISAIINHSGNIYLGGGPFLKGGEMYPNANVKGSIAQLAVLPPCPCGEEGRNITSLKDRYVSFEFGDRPSFPSWRADWGSLISGTMSFRTRVGCFEDRKFSYSLVTGSGAGSGVVDGHGLIGELSCTEWSFSVYQKPGGGWGATITAPKVRVAE